MLLPWTKYEFEDPKRAAFCRDVQAVLTPEENREIQTLYDECFPTGRGPTFKCSDTALIVYHVLFYRGCAKILRARQPVRSLLIKHEFWLRELIGDLMWSGNDHLLLECARAKPEAFCDINYLFDSEALSLVEWIEIANLFPYATLRPTNLTSADIMTLLEHAPETCKFSSSYKIEKMRFELRRRRLMALIVGVSDGLVQPAPDYDRRFFTIAARLPIELQEWLVVILCRDELELDYLEINMALVDYVRPAQRSRTESFLWILSSFGVYTFEISERIARMAARWAKLQPQRITIKECDCRWMLDA